MRIHSSLAAFLALVGSSDAFRMPTATANNRHVTLSVSSTDYLSALSRPSQPAYSAPTAAAPKTSASTTDYLSALSSGANGAPQNQVLPAQAQVYPPQSFPTQVFPPQYANGGHQSLAPVSKAGPFDSHTPKYPVVQGGQTAEFAPPSYPQPTTSFPFPHTSYVHSSHSKAGPFDSMTPKSSVMQGGQTAEFKPTWQEMDHAVGGYQNHDPRPKAGPFDSITPKNPVVQGGQIAEFQAPTAATNQEIRPGGFMNSFSKAGPFDTMTPKDPVVQGGQIAEFRPAPEAATVQQFPHDTTGWTSR